jgi:hypothetical protein
MIAAVLPFGGSNFSVRTVTFHKPIAPVAASFLAGLNSYAYDYLLRQSLGGVHLSDYICNQIPVFPPATYVESCAWAGQPAVTLRDWLLPRILELTYTAWDLQPFAEDCGFLGSPFRWDQERRFLLRCELDAAFFHLYLGTPEDWSDEPQSLRVTFPKPRDAVGYIMDTFPIVRKKDDQQFSTYRTKETILEIYDAMAEASRTGLEYRSLLDPPPGGLSLRTR